MDEQLELEKRQSIIGAVAGGGPVAPGMKRKLTVLPQFNGTSLGALVLEDNVYVLSLTVIVVFNVSLV